MPKAFRITARDGRLIGDVDTLDEALRLGTETGTRLLSILAASLFPSSGRKRGRACCRF
jgi:hypothetical protein